MKTNITEVIARQKRTKMTHIRVQQSIGGKENNTTSQRELKVTKTKLIYARGTAWSQVSIGFNFPLI